MRKNFAIFLSLLSVKAYTQQLVMRGDHADPSVVKIGDRYWASATTSNWFPAYPLLSSSDLVNWKGEGYVFTKKPEWADFYFWAPEISYENGKVYVYYAAHKKDGNLCLSVASADNPAGPYKDHGPIMCEAAGSIDAFPMRDENGRLFIIWKEDGNSVRQPTPIWAQEMNEERTKLVGEKKELFRNSLNWESNLVEGVSMLKIGEYYYAFYAAAGCCGIGCTYQSGIARSKTLLGPWEKYEKNPVLVNTGNWKCPGHGTPVQKDGKYYFLYHAYDTATNIFTGRQGLLQEFRLTADKWIEFINTDSPAAVEIESTSDSFEGTTLDPQWQWSVFQNPKAIQKSGKLYLTADNKYGSGAYLGRKVLTGKYDAMVSIDTRATTSAAGLGAIGDDQNTISILWEQGNLKLYQQREGKDSLVGTYKPPSSRTLQLRLSVSDSRYFHFSYSTDGKRFIDLNKKPLDGSYLPPWDRALRIGIVSKGTPSRTAVFNDFVMRHD